ncbi:MAG TPA: hypothetical protein VKQ36_01720 [Ktedonobacterales bacterium]|nr:hypothetical protein [Ktedonobacterales bacterium]
METRNPATHRRQALTRQSKKDRKTPRMTPTLAARETQRSAANQLNVSGARRTNPLLPDFPGGSSLLDEFAEERVSQDDTDLSLDVWRPETGSVGFPSSDEGADEEEDEEDWPLADEGLSGVWFVKPLQHTGLREWLAMRAPFSWRERSWGRGLWRRSLARVTTIAAIGCVVGLIGLIAFYISFGAQHAVSNLPASGSATPGQSSIVLNSATSITGATPTLPSYEIGVWSSDDMPLGGEVTIYARVTHDYKPVPGVKVSFSVQFPDGAVARYGPVKTNKAGLASAQVSFGGVGQGQLIFVTATTKAGGQNISADTSFAPF